MRHEKEACMRNVLAVIELSLGVRRGEGKGVQAAELTGNCNDTHEGEEEEMRRRTSCNMGVR